MELVKHLLITRRVGFTSKEKDYFLNPLGARAPLLQPHLGQINYLPSIKGAIIFQPPSYANESTRERGRKLVPAPAGEERGIEPERETLY